MNDDLIDFPCSPAWVKHYAKLGMTRDYPAEEMVPIDDYIGNYGANPYCKRCHGAGFVHPTGYHGTPIYSQVVPCDAPGCLLESARDYQSGDPRR